MSVAWYSVPGRGGDRRGIDPEAERAWEAAVARAMEACPHVPPASVQALAQVIEIVGLATQIRIAQLSERIRELETEVGCRHKQDVA